ncbi:nitrilase-related carbon-nitrogen hydrolase [Kribbella sp.]|uniref:nitrilase-related carbon-nitrogen hydrolase n=1 Tax=Kribbella sp. TaxID=1871183 RepID=UPI002D3B237D|nr:nitrilase-related carbon-nitrogen hydrolase [Kribbella sp.]HZX01371.1 nitrilase-related carbon-nitrogen hydrolase [Kribbella sp.]
MNSASKRPSPGAGWWGWPAGRAPVVGGRAWGLGGAAALATGVLLFFGSGLHAVPALTWFAAMPVFLVAPLLRARVAGLAAFVGWLAGLTNLARYLLKDLELPPVALGFLAGLALVFAGTVLFFRALLVRGHPVAAAVAAPALWAALDYLIATVSPHGAFTSLAYTQVEVAPVNQIVSFTGPWGLSFLLLFPAAVIATRRVALLVTLGVVAAGTCLYGVARLGGIDNAQPVKIAVLSAEGADDARWPDAGGPAILERYQPLIVNAAKAGAHIVLLPEKTIDVRTTDLPKLDRQLQRLATSNNIELVAGLTVLGDGDHNRALIFHPDGSTPTSYDKHHLIPGLEPYTPGDHLATYEGWGLMICKDLDFPALARQYGKLGTGLLLVPALDFVDDGWLHSRMAILRGIENGIPIARDGSKGRLTLTDASGRVVAETTAPADAPATLIGELRPGIDRTVYTAWGDWFAWLCGLAALGGVVLLSRRGGRGSIRHGQLRGLPVADLPAGDVAGDDATDHHGPGPAGVAGGREAAGRGDGVHRAERGQRRDRPREPGRVRPLAPGTADAPRQHGP